MSIYLGQLGTLLVATLLATVTTADSVATAAGKAQVAAPLDHANSGQASNEASRSKDKDADDRGVDLGAQPVLLLDRTVKPATCSQPLQTAEPIDGTPASNTGFHPVVERRLGPVEPDEMRQPRLHAGISLLPHGPPACPEKSSSARPVASH